jgi:hypothetical protein
VDVYAAALRDLEEKHAVVAQENAVLRKQERNQARPSRPSRPGRREGRAAAKKPPPPPPAAPAKAALVVHTKIPSPGRWLAASG